MCQIITLKIVSEKVTFKNPIFCALDTKNIEEASQLSKTLGTSVGGVKIGMEFFYAHGTKGYEAVRQSGTPIFLDLKLHDIPNTVASAVRSVLPLKPAILNVHAGGGYDMMRAGVEASIEAGDDRPMMIAVTVLTSLDQTDIEDIGFNRAIPDQVRRLAELSHKAGMDGVVCSAHEIAVLRADRGPDFKLIVPGIRPEGSAVGDQKRVMTPKEAVSAGADILVIGRPITKSDDPALAAQTISASLDQT